MPPPGYEPFLAAVCAAPADDTARLVYADWLEENGDPSRAEFIRVQVELARQAAGGGVEPALADRNGEILAGYGEAWRAELPELSNVQWLGFWRGFVAGADVADGRWAVGQRRVLFAAAPLQRLVLSEAGFDTLRRVMEMHELRHVDALALRMCHVGGDGWGAVTRSAHLTGLRQLEISVKVDARPWYWGQRHRPTLTEDDARAFAQSPCLPRLEELHLIGWVSDAAAAVLRQRFPAVRIDAWRRPT